MWELRLILLLIGVALIAVVYLLSRQRKHHSGDFHRNAPSLEESKLPDVSSDDAAPSLTPIQVPGTHSSQLVTGINPEPHAHQLILALHVTCCEQNGFAGADVLGALRTAGLQYGQHQVFHRLTKDEIPQSVFSVANMLEPGVLEPDALPKLQIPGLTLFLVLPGPQDGVAACADMLATARNLARELDGQVLDDTRNVLTVQSAQRIRERILEFQHRMSDW